MNDSDFHVKELTQWLWEPPESLSSHSKRVLNTDTPRIQENASKSVLKRRKDDCEEFND